MQLQLRTAAIGWIAAVVVSLATATPGAESSTSSSLLIRHLRTSTSTLSGTTSTVDSLIFRDGLIMEHINDGNVLCWILRGTASPEELRELRDALAKNRVDLQRGNCQIKEPIDNFHVETQITWFGRGSRQRTYRTSNGAANPCPESTVEIERAIQSVLASAQGEQTPVTCPV